jgi:hypothetical protein
MKRERKIEYWLTSSMNKTVIDGYSTRTCIIQNLLKKKKLIHLSFYSSLITDSLLTVVNSTIVVTKRI